MTFTIPLSYVYTFMFVFIRVSGLFVSAPLFSSRGIPVPVKALVAFVLSLVVFPNVHPFVPRGTFELFIIALKEFSLGIFLGFLGRILFASFEMAGVFMGFQIGFGIANLLDPFSGEHISVLSQLENILAVLVFLAVDGHHLFLKALLGTFKTVPIGLFSIKGEVVEVLIKKTASMFVTAFELWLPVMVAVLLSHISLGLIAKTAPQLNIFVIGLPLQIALGLLVLTLTMPLIFDFFSREFYRLGLLLEAVSRGL